MTIGLAFWILMLLWLIMGVYDAWPAADSGRLGIVRFGGSFIPWLLFFFLGW